MASSNGASAPNAPAQRISRPVLNIYVGTKAALAGLWIARYELPYLNRADQERVGSLYVDLETLSSDIDEAHRSTSDASPMIKQTLRFTDLSGYLATLNPEQQRWLVVSGPMGTRLPEYTRMGAGGIRQNGHGAVIFNSAIVEQHIESLINNISAVDSAGHAPDTDLITINIVCFLGGGTGSGALPALATLSRHVLRKLNRGGNIFIYAMLPVNVGNIPPERQTIQKSNSLAALLELEALLLKGDDKSQAFTYEMGNLSIRVPSGLVDEIFLLEDTQLGDQIEQISQLVGMAIAMRMQNLTGIGKREQALRPDLTALQEHDDAGLITNVGSLCPLDVIYPAHDLAVGFARRRAEALLRQATQPVTLDYREEDLVRTHLCPARKIMEAFRVTDRERRAAPDPRRWGGSEVIQAINRYGQVIEQAFAEQRQQALNDQIAALDSMCANPSWARSLPRLEAALNIWAEEYRKVKELTVSSGPSMSRMGPDQLAADNERKRKAYYQQACAEELQRHRITQTNAIADAMLEEIAKRQRMLNTMLATLNFTQQRWEAEHAESPEMRGQLTQEHPYRHNVFDHTAIEPGAINLLDTAVTDAEAELILKRGTEHMAAALSGPETAARETAGREAVALMDAMMVAYEQRLGELRLLQAIQMVYPKDRVKQEAALANHMRWMSDTARATLRHDPSLWGDQASRQLEVRAHLAVDYEDERERQWVERARQSVGGFGERGPGYVPSGEILPSNDPFRLDMLFSHHGISITAIPYLSDAAGGCVKSLRDRLAMWQNQGGIPVFSCDALQELVTRPGIFFDPADRMAASGTTPGAKGADGSYGYPTYGYDIPAGGSSVTVSPNARNLIDRVERRAHS
jgi:hypothetical protein